jgi:uncharacterized protein YbjT (DUF2867 family)
MRKPVVAVAGAGGDLGRRIVRELVLLGAEVRALLRAGVDKKDELELISLGAVVIRADWSGVSSLASELAGVEVVVSALNGLRDVIIDRQRLLLEAAVSAGVGRFFSSDFALDYTKTAQGLNRNLDFRREFMVMADRAPIRVTSILNGAFMDMLGAEMPIIQKGINRVLYWRCADQKLDFTTKDNVAAFTARAVLDVETPRILRISGDSLSVRQMAEQLSKVTGERYCPMWVGSLSSLSVMIKAFRWISPQNEVVFPPWQGMQYMRDMFSGQGELVPIDNGRYGDIKWTSVHEYFAQKFKKKKPL